MGLLDNMKSTIEKAASAIKNFNSNSNNAYKANESTLNIADTAQKISKKADALASKIAPIIKYYSQGYSVNESKSLAKYNSDNWYDGDEPTAADWEAMVYARTLDQSNPQMRELRNQAYAELDKMYADPTSPYFDNSRVAGSKYLTELQDNGFDISGGLNDEFFAKNRYMYDLLEPTNGGTAYASPGTSNKVDPKKKAAYALWQAEQDYNATKEVQADMDRMYNDIAYLVKRGYSNEEIANEIKLDDYKAAKKQYELGKEKYLPGTNTSAVGYNDDTIEGMIWSARNGGESKDWNKSAVQSKLGIGEADNTSPAAIARRNKLNSKTYNPNADGSNVHDLCKTFGVTEFGDEWDDPEYVNQFAGTDK